jgi:hypothetical protein
VLLQAGANPVGADCSRADSPLAPVRIARESGWREMIETMLANMERREVARLYEPPQRGPVPPEARNTLERLVERYRDRLEPGRTQIVATVEVDAAGTSRSCELKEATGVAEIDDELCRLIDPTHRWSAARNAFGERVAGEGTVKVQIVDLDPR